MKKVFASFSFLSVVVFLFPLLAGAQTLQGVRDFKGFVAVAIGVLGRFAVFLVGLAVFIIISGVFKYITKAADPEARREGLRFIAYGVIGVFVMVSMWGLVRVLTNTFYFSGSNLPAPASQGTTQNNSGSADTTNNFCLNSHTPTPDDPDGCWQ
jgi:hypothetical protein